MRLTTDFILYRLPNKNEFTLWCLSDKQDNDTYFIFHSFDNKTTRRLYRKEEISLNYNQLNDLTFDLPLKTIDTSAIALSHQEYIKTCTLFIEALQQQELAKVVLSRIKFAAAQQNHGEKLIKLAKKYPSAMVYLANFDGETWMGASPEKLVQIHQNKLTTVALASTKAISDNRDWTSKEYKEQQLVVDYVAEQLKAYQPIKGTTETITLGEIQHLKTNFSAEINDSTNKEEVCNLLHPTPAVCGMPKEKAHQFILKNEGYDRRFYTGYFGVISEENTEVYVNLRCAQLYSNQMAIYVGGGLLAESDPEKEWQETEWKSKALL